VYADKTLPYKKDAKFFHFDDAVVYKDPMFDEDTDSLSTTVENIFD
jgi:hypothetical protein